MVLKKKYMHDIMEAMCQTEIFGNYAPCTTRTRRMAIYNLFRVNAGSNTSITIHRVTRTAIKDKFAGNYI